MHAAADAKTYRVGDPIRLDLQLKNTSKKPYMLVDPRMPSGWYPTMAFGVRLTRDNKPLLQIQPSDFYQGSYSGPPGFKTLPPGKSFHNSICLQHWLDWQLNLPLPEGNYELAIAFDSNKFAGMQATGVELAHRWDAKPITFTVRGAMRTDAIEILKLVGEKAGEKYIQSDLISPNAARRNWARSTIWEYGDSRLRPYLEKIESEHKAIYGEDRSDLDRLSPVESHRN